MLHASNDHFHSEYMILTFALLILGFVILIKGADWLVGGSVSLAKHYRISELAIGLTIVAFGTSAPELVVNILSSLQGYSDVTMGNVVGSNLFNLLFILGVSGLIFPISVKIKTIWKEIPFSLLAAAVLLFFSNVFLNRNGIRVLTRAEGIILLAFFTLFLGYIILNMKGEEAYQTSEYRMRKPGASGLLIVVGLAFLVIGSRLVIDNAVEIARNYGASEKLIGITIISAGTSLPELVTSVVAAIKRNSDIAIGNVIGSNIFNIFFILGVSTIITPVEYNKSFNTDLILLITGTLLLFIFMFSGKKYRLDRWESLILLTGYVAYVVWAFYQ